jgi:hypothetical protein
LFLSGLLLIFSGFFRAIMRINKSINLRQKTQQFLTA